MANQNPQAVVVPMLDRVTDVAAQAKIVLAPATHDERKKLIDVAELAFPDPPGWASNPNNTEHYTQSDGDFANRLLVCIVAKMAGDLVGYIMYQPQSRRPQESYIKEMGVHPNAQGNSIGVYLLAYAVADALQKGSSQMKLYTTRGANTKKGFYAKWGFAEVPLKNYKTDGYTTDDDKPDRRSLLMSGPLQSAANSLSTYLKL